MARPVHSHGANPHASEWGLISFCGVCAHITQVSTALGAAIPEERAHNAWIEGVAIWVAILIVVSVGEWWGLCVLFGRQAMQ